MKQMKSRFPRGFVSPHELSGMAENTPILVALSGGADSCALLFSLLEQSKTSGAPLCVAHVDHKLRGTDSNRDREFCRDLAARYHLPFYVLEADVAALAEQNRLGIEEQARHTRYAFFESVMREHNVPLLATAHNADDNAETLLFHLARGSGLNGLCGIAPTRDFGGGKLIRPFLGATKADILAFCGQNGIEYVTDVTNTDTRYSRNRIRHNVIPELATINSGFLENVSRLCTAVRQDQSYLTEKASEFVENNVKNNTIPLESLNREHPAIQNRAVAMLLSRFTDDIRAVHIQAVLSLSQAGTEHSSLDLGDGVRATIENRALIFGTGCPPPPAKHYCYTLHEGENPIPEADMLILVERAPTSHKSQTAFKNVYKKATTTSISFDKIDGSLTAEPRREGDTILAGGIHKKVKKLMCDQKIPLSLRQRIPLLRDSQGIVWIPDIALRDNTSNSDNQIEITLFYNT